MAGFVVVIWGGREVDYFCVRGWTGQITLKLLRKIAQSRTAKASDRPLVQALSRFKRRWRPHRTDEN
jgi:hypothetical protein